MTLPTSGPISLSQVSVELGRPATYPTSLGETAVWNLSHTGDTNTGPFGPTVSMSSLYGKTAAAPSNFSGGVSLSYNSFNSNGTLTMSLTVSLNTDGTITWVGSGYKTFHDTLAGQLWYSPSTSGIGSNYWVYVSVESGGTLTSGTTGWQPLSATRSWNIQASVTKTSGGVSNIATLDYIIAASSGGPTLASGKITMDLEGSGSTPV